MSVRDLTEKLPWLKTANAGELDRAVSGVYCCDLLSLVMGRAFADCAWVTVMGNMNSVAVASLADMSCVIVAENMPADEPMLVKARENGITVLTSEKAVYETAAAVGNLIKP